MKFGLLALAAVSSVYASSNNNVVLGDGIRGQGDNNKFVGAGHISYGNNNWITGNQVPWIGNGLRMFGVNAAPQFAAGLDVDFSSLPNYRGPGAGYASNSQLYSYLDQSWNNRYRN